MEERIGSSGFDLWKVGISRLLQAVSDHLVRLLRPHWIRQTHFLDGYERFGPLELMAVPDGRRLSVVAPHPDDESIGAGGLIALWSGRGRRAQVVMVTDGAAGHPRMRESVLSPEGRAALAAETAAKRRGEGDLALALLGADGTWLDGTDGALWQDEARMIEALTREWRSFQPDCLAVPFPADRHRDHAVAARIAAAAGMAVLPQDTPVLSYEVWSPCPANVVLDISLVAAIKDRSIACHVSQTSSTNYVAAMQGLSQYRAITAGLTADARVEAFYRCTLAEFADLCTRLKV